MIPSRSVRVAWLAGSFLILFCFFSIPLQACVVCGSEGACFDQPSTLSGNCKCVISSRFGMLVCKPQGVCDPNDPNPCPDDGGNGFPTQATVPGLEIRSRFITLAGAKDPLLGAALWGAIEEEEDGAGRVVNTRIVPGEHQGTMGTPDHRSFTYHTFVQQIAEDLFRVKVSVEEEGEEGVRRYDGLIYENGARGEIARIDLPKPKAVLVWDVRGTEKPRP
jgi:predicted RNA-binding protein